ncbi:hypothetical protein HUU05_24455, partial [candidate division KSB1 bacterium]|nr:hypothetical protein [candidate division KSB1 bacterium]
MSDCNAVLLDTVSIQNYIFQSNKLKENLGASHLVREIYRSYLVCALSTITRRSYAEEYSHLNDWKTSIAEIPDCSKTVDVGYIGGGNALLFFQTESQAQKFIEAWTKLLLIHAPGLTTAVAYSRFSIAPAQFKENLKELFRQLEANKSRHCPITSLPRHGITAECARSGISVETYNKNIKAYVSANVNARIEAAAESKDEIENEYRAHLQGRYCFPDELDKLGGIEGEDSHIAIVHIDGNDIGQSFKAAENLGAIRRLSVDVDETTRSAFKAVVQTSTEKYGKIMDSLGFDDHSHPKLEGKKILPIRPIILGGDDVTFVCDGKLGIYFAKLFIEKFQETKINGESLTASAGVAIIKTKYPFYRGYWLAEELCASAKRKRKMNSDWGNASLLDFHISLGGVAGSLKDIRQRFYGRDESGG